VLEGGGGDAGLAGELEGGGPGRPEAPIEKEGRENWITG
jgi:hypothetical protein